MLEAIVEEKSFQKDRKKLEKKHFDFSELKNVLDMLMQEVPLPNRYKNHSLSGKLKGYYDCHINNDKIVMIYKIFENRLILFRIGSHKDVFNK